MHIKVGLQTIVTILQCLVGYGLPFVNDKETNLSLPCHLPVFRCNAYS